MSLRKRYKLALGGAFLVAMGGLSARSLLAGPSTAARPAEVERAKREASPPAGADDRVPLPPPGAVAGNGVVEPADRETKVSAQVPGRVARVVVAEGEFVARGAPLVELERGFEEAALRAAEADLAAAEAELAKAQRGQRREEVEAAVGEAEAARARAALSADALARTERLAQKGAATADELERARRQAESDARSHDVSEARRRAAEGGSRREDVAAARARADAARARRDQAREALERLTVRSPIEGAVLQVKARAGEYEAPGGDPLVVVGDTRRLRVRMDVDERDVGRVKPGARARVMADAFPGAAFGGKVAEIGRRMGRKNVRTDDPVERIDTKILEVVIDLDEPAGLVPGLRVAAHVDAPG
ncbi:MAG TPA: efflux RND transporter periplasmic adaptor subunit [Polyangiaceae bacterium]|nr:efflux RND transporter periplasmic adaptor subunit [Polyangiaceae bacterium]